MASLCDIRIAQHIETIISMKRERPSIGNKIEEQSKAGRD